MLNVDRKNKRVINKHQYEKKGIVSMTTLPLA